jgi:sugar phosphate isomerase/epimerase
MNKNPGRRKFIKSALTVPAIITAHSIIAPATSYGEDRSDSFGDCRLKTSLNAFSFNDLLMSGNFSLDEMLDFCVDNCMDAVDITGYYLPGYPNVPPDDFIYDFKRKAFIRGLEISGTGIRNNFTDPDKEKRKADIQLIKNWIECASKLGAPVIRIFAGQPADENDSWDKILDWLVDDVNECVEYGKAHGVMIGIQNHNDFIKTSGHANKILDRIKSDWFGLILDTGSYHSGDPYEEIKNTARFALNWQIKKNVYINGKEEPVDLKKLIRVIRESGYKGYLPIETLPPDNPRIEVPVLLKKLKNAIRNS